LGNELVHTLGVAHDLVVPQAQDAETAGAEEGITLTIVGDLRCVAVAVGFDDQLGVDAGKIGVVGTDRVLAAEVIAALSELWRMTQRWRSGIVGSRRSWRARVVLMPWLRRWPTPTPVPSP
jgi:hypothetical protein